MATEETINKITNYLNYMKSLCDSKDKTHSLTRASRERNVSSVHLRSALTLHYFTKLKRGKYICNIVKFEPIHARHVLDETNRSHRKYWDKNYKEEKPQVKAPYMSSYDDLITTLKWVIKRFREQGYEIDVQITTKTVTKL